MNENVIFEDNKLKYYSLDYILENFDKFDFKKISTNSSITYPTSNGDITYKYTNEENCVGIGKIRFDRDNALYIDEDYYLKNKEEIDKKLASIVSKFKESELASMNSFMFIADLTVDGKNLINDSIIDAISNNKDISNISLINQGEENYKLTKEVYEKLKQSGHITKIDTIEVEPELEDNFDPMIKCNYDAKIFDAYTYKELQGDSIIIFNWPKEKQNKMKNAKYINPNCKITVRINDNEELEEFIKGITSFNLKNELDIKISDKTFFNSNIVKYFDESILDKTKVEIELYSYSLKDYLNYEKRLNDLVKDAMNLSPFERYVYAYNVAKNFKPYKENEEDKMSSRNIYSILDNEFMVCVGYSGLLADLLTRLGISAKKISEGVNVGFDNAPDDATVMQDYEAERGGHARVMVKIVDPKYGINGVYYADPTWDNNLDVDFYNHILMTGEEYNNQDRENFHNDFDLHELYEAQSIEEFYSRVNYYLYKINSEEKNKSLERDINRYSKTMEDLFNQGINTYDLLKTINEVIKVDLGKGDNNFFIGRYDRVNIIKHIVSDIKYSLNKEMSSEKLKELVTKSITSLNKNEHHLEDEGQIQVCRVLNDYIKTFNPGLYEKISNECPIAIKDAGKLDSSQFASYIEQVGEYITSMNNNKVKGSTILEAVKEVYKVKTIENVDEKIEETRKINEKMYDYGFPQRPKVTDEGEEVYMNEENNFSEGKTR